MPLTDLAGRSFLVTGASSGIGLAAVEGLLARGGAVTLANRSEDKTQPILASLRERHPGAELHFVRLDLADLADVKRCAEDVLASGRPLDVLVNNAGLAGARGQTKDGFELTFGTNHLGPFLLTNLLLPRILASPQGRIVNVSSAASLRVREVDWELATRPVVGRVDGLSRYGLSKFLNVVHARELARRLEGTAVTTSSLHPGAVATDVWRSLPGFAQVVLKWFMLSNEEGARTTLYCATAPELAKVSGRYYEREKERAPNPLALDPALGTEMWTRSEAMIHRSLGVS